jgi:hypothetical protein
MKKQTSDGGLVNADNETKQSGLFLCLKIN